MAWHCVYLIFPTEFTVYSWIFHAILLLIDRLFNHDLIKKKSKKLYGDTYEKNFLIIIIFTSFNKKDIKRYIPVYL